MAVDCLYRFFYRIEFNPGSRMNGVMGKNQQGILGSGPVQHLFFFVHQPFGKPVISRGDGQIYPGQSRNQITGVNNGTALGLNPASGSVVFQASLKSEKSENRTILSLSRSQSHILPKPSLSVSR